MTATQARIFELSARIAELEGRLGLVDASPAIRRIPGLQIAMVTAIDAEVSGNRLSGSFVDYDPQQDKWVRTTEHLIDSAHGSMICDVLNIFSFDASGWRRCYVVKGVVGAEVDWVVIQAACDKNPDDD